MALYRRGTASMDADGTVRGTDTKWKDQLALIRVGATIVFLEQPIKLAVISDIVSDTELKAISTDGQTAADGKYVILLNDSLTVNGLAQNVAETLRYYQSKETEIAAAIDLINQLDMNKLEQIVADVNQAKSDSQAAQNQAELARDAANSARDETNSIKNQTQQIVDSAVGSINAAKDQAITDIGSKESSVITHIDTEEAAAIQAINEAKGDLSGYVNDAQTAAQTATSAKNDAQAARDAAVSAKGAAAVSAQEAQDAANSVNADNLLTKDGNLAGLEDKLESWKNLRPDAPLELLKDPEGNMDATTKGWVEKGLKVNDWSIYKNVDSEPPSGSDCSGGRIDSKFKVGEVDKYRSSFELQGGNEIDIWTRITTINDRYKQGAATWDFKLDGKLIFNKGLVPNGTGYAPCNTYLTLANTWMSSQYSGYIGLVGGAVGVSNGGWRNFISLGSIIFPNGSHPQAAISQVYDYDMASGNQPNGDLVRNTLFNAESYDITFGNNLGTVNYIFSKSPVSDERLKSDINDIETRLALDNLMKMKYRSFTYNHDKEKTVRRGFIAQQLMSIDSQYVRKYGNMNGEDYTLSLDENVLLLDAIAAIQELSKQVSSLKEEIKLLKQS